MSLLRPEPHLSGPLSDLELFYLHSTDSMQSTLNRRRLKVEALWSELRDAFDTKSITRNMRENSCRNGCDQVQLPYLNHVPLPRPVRQIF
jgi:hypothetical protein